MYGVTHSTVFQTVRASPKSENYFLELSIFPAADAASNLLVLIYWFNFLPIYFPPSPTQVGVRPYVPPLRAFSHCKNVRKIVRLLQSVLWICKSCSVYNYRLFFFEKYLVEFAKIHNFEIKETLIAEKKPR